MRFGPPPPSIFISFPFIYFIFIFISYLIRLFHFHLFHSHFPGSPDPSGLLGPRLVDRDVSFLEAA